MQYLFLENINRTFNSYQQLFLRKSGKLKSWGKGRGGPNKSGTVKSLIRKK